MSTVEVYVPSQSRLPQYCKVRQLGDPYVRDLLTGPVVVEEKVDGANFRFMKKDGKVLTGSHKKNFDEFNHPDKAFRGAVAYVESIADRIPEGVVFFAELLSKPKHNTIAYGRVPLNGIYLFDAYNLNEAPLTQDAFVGQDLIQVHNGLTVEPNSWASLEVLRILAAQFDVDPPNVLLQAELTKEGLEAVMGTDSYLGNSLIEGVVVKNYALPGHDPHHAGNFPMMAKLVRKSFKEENDINWKVGRDIGAQVVLRYKTNARWEKALQHLREGGTATGTMKDMRGLIDEIQRDINEECQDAIKQMLWEHYERDILKGVAGGMAEWFKEKLAAEQFGDTPTDHETTGGE